MMDLTEWQKFEERCARCQRCELHESRTNAVVYRGSIEAPLMIIGEGPGREEDEQGIPFVGRSGKVLDSALKGLGIPEDVFHIANIVKCRPPGNRKPTHQEALACRPLLQQQFLFAKPKVILLMGATAYQYFTGDTKGRISQLRGQWLREGDCDILPTFHPAYILRSPSQRVHLWSDLEATRRKLEELGYLEPLTGLSE